MKLRQSATVALLPALLLALAAPPCGADRARLGDDEGGLEAGDCELELAFERHRARAADRGRERGAQLSCGIGWRSEFALATAREHAGSERADALALELKSTRVPRRDASPGWAARAAVAAARPAAGSWRRSDVALGVEATVEPRPAWLGELQLGWARDLRGRADRFAWLLGVEHAPAPAWVLRGELAGDDRQPALAGAAVRLALGSDAAWATLSWGRRLGADRERRLGLALGLEF